LSRFFLHEYRDTHAAFMITAGVNAKAFSTYMGHSTITMTRRGRSPELGSDIPKLAEYLDACETSRRTKEVVRRTVVGKSPPRRRCDWAGIGAPLPIGVGRRHAAIECLLAVA
jgi:hypothetical protein